MSDEGSSEKGKGKATAVEKKLDVFSLIINGSSSVMESGPKSEAVIQSSTETTPAEASVAHDADPLVNCRCGCVPNIMSLFQMAELRARRRKEREREALLKKEEREEEMDEPKEEDEET